MAPSQSSFIEEDALRRSSNFIPVPSVYDHDIRFENRNAEELHHGILEAARLEHERVRNEAMRIFQITLMQEQQLQAHHKILVEEERLRIEEIRLKIEEKRVKTERQTAGVELKRRELEEAARRIPIVPPKPPTPPPVAAPIPTPAQTASDPPRTQLPPAQQQQQHQQEASGGLFGAPKQQTNAFVQNNPPQQPKGLSQPQPQPPRQTNGFSNAQQPPKQSLFQPPPPPPQQPSGTWQSSSSSNDHIIPGVERYAQIHKNLKELRQYLVAEGKRNIEFKKMLGDMRRSLRQTVGQLTSEKGANKQCINKIHELLAQSLHKLQSPGIDPSNYMISKPNPVEGAQNNGDQLPSLFIYLLNFFAKAIVSQFINEASVRPETADPIGVVAVSIFARDAFLWRGSSLIDILMAKMRVSIPTVFGIRGNEKTEEGRARIGWQRTESGWIDDQSHSNRMVGLAAGYAAISLRDFSKTRLTNPWPPTYYWRAVASIVSTPAQEASSTQYTVLRSLIEGWEQRFIDLYGVQAVAALRVALVDFPTRASPSAKVAADSLSILADKLLRDKGLKLDF
ncbi:hypothetical protein SBOR_6085 [Sclerotinia borealis F-4128]|uniref:mRNA export factor GLE1 n=1 Tax=Sclerotinia borealis (strain F-4128) TaxID=1432307 RepID=W9CCJ4_SCLBF|nr:hypothetical protein SBOR_6085 [Sclerotinia borealis F-4128]